ncbi:Chondroitin polymerase [Shewanella putrefaciens]|nr:Chondroitin polymerase [Shewanella putrefaciens]
MKLSVLVPVFKLEKFVEACLVSLLEQQTNFTYEVIVVDDASVDNSWQIICTLAQRYSHLISFLNVKNQGLARTQKTLLSLARGEYLVYVDGDDLALPGKLQAISDYLDTHPNCALVYHEAEVFDSDTGIVTSHYSRDYYNARFIPQQATAVDLVKYGCFVNASSIGFRRHGFLEQAVDEECKIILDHPWHILNALYGRGSVDFIPEVLGRYRIHSQSFGSQTKRSPERREQVLADQLRACDNAAALGLDNEVVEQGKAHYRFATALYFLKLGDQVRFNRFINESSNGQWFFDHRHKLAWLHRNNPQYVVSTLFGGC